MRNKGNSVLWTPAVILAGCLAGCQGQSATEIDAELWRRADELARKHIIIDGHQDVPYRLGKKTQDISKRTKTGDFDYPRARQGGLDAALMAAYVAPEYEEKGGARRFADETIDMIEGWAQRWPDKFALAASVEEVREQFGEDRVSMVITIENGSPIEGNLANIKHFYDRGVRCITLVHSVDNHICDSSYDEEPKWKGLSPFGREVVAEMNRLGMIIDVSHASDDAFYQIMELSKAPVAATHSSCRHFTPGWMRNMDDKMIKLLAANGGIIQINFGSMFVNGEVNRQFRDRSRHVAELIKAKGLEGDDKEAYVKKYVRAHPVGEADILDVVANIDHVVKLVGIDHVGLGSDFDGVGGHLPDGLKDVSCYVNLVYELLKAGYTEEDVGKICSDNFLRVWSRVERTGAELRAGK